MALELRQNVQFFLIKKIQCLKHVEENFIKNIVQNTTEDYLYL
jgi:hypothetical protein